MEATAAWLDVGAGESSAYRYLLNPDQEELTEVEMMILNCAAQAKLSKKQMDEVFTKVGAARLVDLLELHEDDYDHCDFKPLLKLRLKSFQLRLKSNQPGRRAEEDVTARASPPEDGTARGSGDAVAAAPPAPPAPPPPAEKDVSARGSGDAVAATPPAAPAPPAPALLCTFSDLCREHKPTKGRRGDPHYWFFNAVSQGCQPCVQKLVKEKNVEKNVKSYTQGYTAIDFAEWFEQPEMLAFLATL